MSIRLPIDLIAALAADGRLLALQDGRIVGVEIDGLGLGTLALQDADAVAITGGTIAGIAGLVGTHYQQFSTSGAWTKPSGIRWAYVRGWGAGGGGQGGGSGYGGGGGGGYVDALFLASALAATVIVTIGAGGVSGASPTAGGSSSFGTHLVAPGGTAGSQFFSGLGAGVYLGSFAEPPQRAQGGYAAGGGGLGLDGVAGYSRHGGGSVMGGGGGASSGTAGGTGGSSLYGGRGADASNNAAAPGGGGWGNSGIINHKNGALGRIQVWGW